VKRRALEERERPLDPGTFPDILNEKFGERLPPLRRVSSQHASIANHNAAASPMVKIR
jgi:hypothetical protein